jgi:hypothetical protein
VRAAALILIGVQQRHTHTSGVPTVLRTGPYRLFFYSADAHEPPHLHAERDGNSAKFWLNPVALHSSSGFARRELLDPLPIDQ